MTNEAYWRKSTHICHPPLPNQRWWLNRRWYKRQHCARIQHWRHV